MLNGECVKFPFPCLVYVAFVEGMATARSGEGTRGNSLLHFSWWDFGGRIIQVEMELQQEAVRAHVSA